MNDFTVDANTVNTIVMKALSQLGINDPIQEQIDIIKSILSLAIDCDQITV